MKNLRRPNIALVLLAILGFAEVRKAHSDELNLSVRSEVKRARFGLNTELIRLQGGTVSLNGIGVQFAFEYAMSPKWGVLTTLSQAMQLTGGLSYFYTGIGAFAKYSVTGSGFETRKLEVLRYGRSIVKQAPQSLQGLSVGAGVEQLIVNGTFTVYPAPGISGLVSYSFPMWNTTTQATLRGGLFSKSDSTFLTFFAGFGFLL